MAADPTSARELHDELLAIRFDPGGDRPYATVRRQLLQLLESADAAGVALDMFDHDWTAAPLLSDRELAQLPPHLLLVWCDDIDGCGAYAIPFDAPDPVSQLLADARQLRGHRFGDASDCTPAELAAAIRLLASFRPWPAKKVYDGWRDEIESLGAEAVGIRSADDIAPFIGALRDHCLSGPARFAHHVAEISSVSKAS